MDVNSPKQYFLLAFILGYQALIGQQPIYINFQKFDPEHGLPQSYVTGIAQDFDGFIWVGTTDGLARYNGQKFLAFRPELDNSSTLSTGRMSGVIIDRNNQLWIQHLNGLVDRMDPVTFKVLRNVSGLISNQLTPSTIQNVLVKGEGADWFSYCNGKLQLMDTTIVPLKQLIKSKIDRVDEAIHGFTIDERGGVWLVAKSYLLLFDPLSTELKQFAVPRGYLSDVGGFIRPTFRMGNTLVIADVEHLVGFNMDSRSFFKISLPRVSQEVGKNIIAATQDHEGRIVFGYHNSILRLEKNFSTSLLWKYPGAHDFSSILIDRSNTLWVGLNAGGLIKVNLLAPAFVSYGRQQNFITDVLVNEFDVSKSYLKQTWFINPLASYSPRYSYVEKDSILIALENNYQKNVYRLQKGSLKKVFESARAIDAFIALEDTVWILDNEAIINEWKDIRKSPKVKQTKLPRDVTVDMLRDGQSFWMGISEGKIFRIRDGETIDSIQLKSSFNTFRLDPIDNNILWVGTLGEGLLKWSKKDHKFVAAFDSENGFPNNTINAIVFDSLGRLWASTNVGIACLDPAKGTTQNFTTADGLNEIEFNRHHQMLLPNGYIVFGGSNGYTKFNPLEFKTDTFDPSVTISSMSINGRELDHRTDTTILPKPILQLDRIDLSHTQNSIDILLASLQYNATEKNRYRYKLEGKGNDWIYLDRDNHVRFSFLPYGTYKLVFNVSNTSGIWSSHERSLTLVIHPPFWLSWWAYSIYLVVAGTILFIFWRAYKLRLKEKQEAEFNQREAVRLREMDEMKTRFFSNITHEFRTPLTLILTPLQKYLNDKSLSPKALTLLNNNYRHANQLLRLVNQLLDIAKVEAGQMQLNLQAGNLMMFVEQCIIPFQEQAKEKQIELRVATGQLEGHYLFDQEKWEKIINNLLSNALKFTSSGGYIEVNGKVFPPSTDKGDLIRFEVRDSGIGIDSSEVTKIFERFYQVDDSTTRKHEGTGIGLALVKELIDLMHGKIHVESSPDSGTSFTLEVPIERLKEIPPAQEVTSINNVGVEIEKVPGIDHENPLVLVVEDNDELRAFVKESLETNWTVIEASNGDDAWAIVQRELPEIVVSDVMMPGISGIDLCKKVKGDARTAHIGFIMLTAKAAQEARLEGLEAGTDQYLTKPFHLQELELRVRNLLQEQLNLRGYLQGKLIPSNPIIEVPHVSDVFLTKIQEFISANLDNVDLNVDAVATEMAMSRSTMNRKIKALLGISLNEYIKQFRLQKATALLISGYSVSEVSYKVGFDSASYFSQCFKEHYQQSPSDFLKDKRLNQN